MRAVSTVSFEPVVATGSKIKSLSAMTGEPLAELPQSTADDVAVAFALARDAQRHWARVPLAERAGVLLRFHDLLLRRQDEIIDLIQLETGKARWHAFQETASTAMNARYYGFRGAKVLVSANRRGLLPGLTKVTEHRVPLGVVGVISPWNYPFDTAVSDILPALLAGNGVVHKPDNQGVLCAMWGHRLLREAGVPDGLYQIVPGDGPTVGGALVDHADHVCFTGSTRTGKIIAERASRRLIGVSLELGGKNPLLVLEDADPAKAAWGAVRDCFTSAGQLCGSSERIYVHERVYDEFVERFLKHIRALRLGPQLAYGPDMGSLVSREQLERVRSHVDDAVAKGANVLIGGRARPDIGPHFYEATVLTGVREGMDCFAEETFGPVVSLYKVSSTEEAIRLANASNLGLNSCVWSKDQDRAQAVAARLKTGTVNINEVFGISYGSVDSPMGGMKDSGLGRRHGAEGILRFTEAQTIASQRGMPLEPPLKLNYGVLAKAYTVALRAFRWLHRP